MRPELALGMVMSVLGVTVTVVGVEAMAGTCNSVSAAHSSAKVARNLPILSSVLNMYVFEMDDD